MADNYDGVIVSIGRQKYRTEVRMPSDAGGGVIVADEPRDVGGGGEGPGPYELLLASLGTCKAMTLRMYADRKGWPLEEVVVTLRHEKRHADDCENCEDPKARLDHFDVELQVLGDLSAEQRERLAEISDRCPVHKTMTSEIRIGTTLVSEDM